MLRALAKSQSTRRGARRAQLACILFAGLSVLVGSAIAIYAAAQPALPGWATLSAFIGGVAGGAGMAGAALSLASWLGQRRRDLEAAEIWARLCEDPSGARPFCLYLRPFASTDEIAGEDAVATQMAFGRGPQMAVARGRTELEAEIEHALRPIGPLIALGQPLEHIGAGRIAVTDADWRNAIRLLIETASLIVLLPSSRAGTLWEVETLLQSDALSKTIVIDPPNPLAETDDDTDYDHAAEWEDVRAAFAAAGRRLPEDDPNGLLAAFEDESDTPRTAGFSSNHAAALRRFAKSLLRRRKAATLAA